MADDGGKRVALDVRRPSAYAQEVRKPSRAGRRKSSAVGTEGSAKKVDFQRSMDYSESYTKLCRLLTEGVKIAVKDVFDSFFPPIILADKLRDINTQRRLEHLANKGLIDDKQFTKLYPKTRQKALSANYDTMLLMVILKHICKLPPPYPNGWYGQPRAEDESVPAQLTRLSLLRKETVNIPSMSEEHVAATWSAAMTVMCHLSRDVTDMAEKIQAEPLEEEVRYIYVKRLYSLQDKENDIVEREEQMKKPKNANDVVMMGLTMDTPEHTGTDLFGMKRPATVCGQSSSVPQSAQPRRNSAGPGGNKYMLINQNNGMPKEERYTLLTFYKSLVTHIKASEIMDQLIKVEIFNTEDKINVFHYDKNRERMDTLLRILLTKPASAYEEFCKPIKFKHAHLFELMNRTYTTLKRQASFRKPDGLLHTMEHLRQYYNDLMTNWTPITWAGAQSTSVSEHYTPLQLAEQNGENIDDEDIIDSPSDHVLIYGPSGSGKSALSRYLVQSWLRGRIRNFSHYALVFYIDCAKDKILKEVMYEQLSKEYQFNSDELWRIVDDNQNKVLLILDGLEENSKHFKLLFVQRRLPDIGIIVTSSSKTMIGQNFTRKLNLLGLSKMYVGEFITKYMNLTQNGPEDFNTFYQKLSTCDEEFQAFVLKPFLCTCLCAIRANKMSCDVETESELLEQFLQALMKSKRGRRMEFTNEIHDGLQQLQHLVFMAVMNDNSNKLQADEVLRKCGKIVVNLGLLHKTNGQCYVVNKTLNDFLIARHIQTIKTDEFEQFMDIFTSSMEYSDVCRFLCGIHDKMENLEILKNLVDRIRKQNLEVQKAVSFLTGSEREFRGHTTARIIDLNLSLTCVRESKGCEWIAQMVAESLPERIVLKSGLVSQTALLGLAEILRLNLKGVKELDIYVTEDLGNRRYGLLKIASAIGCNDYVRFLRLEWSSSELLARFLNDTFKEETKIHTVKMIDKSTKTHDTDKNALVQAHLLRAVSAMTNVDTIIFQDCKTTSMVLSLVRNLSIDLTTLDLSGCQMNIICTKELAHYLEYTLNLKILNLTDVKLSGMIFSYFSKGLNVNHTIEDLILCNCKIDQRGQYLLAESLHFNGSIRRLDLSKNKLTYLGSKRIAEAIRHKHIYQFVILGDEIDKECKKVFHEVDREDLRIIEDRPFVSPNIYAD